MVDQPEETSEEQQDSIAFHYIKSNYFRVIHVDGAWGGTTPQQNIHMALYSERHPIPQQTVNPILRDENQLGEEILSSRVARKGIVREVEVNAVLNTATAKVLIKWLQDRVDFIENLPREARQKGEEV